MLQMPQTLCEVMGFNITCEKLMSPRREYNQISILLTDLPLQISSELMTYQNPSSRECRNTSKPCGL